jgi:hypothetical protein
MVIRKTISTIFISLVACGVTYGAHRGANAEPGAPAPHQALGNAFLAAREAREAAAEKARSAARQAAPAANAAAKPPLPVAPARRNGNVHGLAAAAPVAQAPEADLVAALREQNRVLSEQLQAQAERDRRRDEQMAKLMEMAVRQNAPAHAAAAPAAAPVAAPAPRPLPPLPPVPARRPAPAAAPAPLPAVPAKPSIFGRIFAAAKVFAKKVGEAGEEDAAPAAAVASPAKLAAQKFTITFMENRTLHVIDLDLDADQATAINRTVFADRAKVEKIIKEYTAANPKAMDRTIEVKLESGTPLIAPLLGNSFTKGKTAAQLKEDIERYVKAQGDAQMVVLFIPGMLNAALKQMQGIKPGAKPKGAKPAPAVVEGVADAESSEEEDLRPAHLRFKEAWKHAERDMMGAEAYEDMEALNELADNGADGLAYGAAFWLNAADKAVGMFGGNDSSSDDDDAAPAKKAGVKKQESRFADMYAQMAANNKKKPDKKDDKKNGGADQKHNGRPAAKK